ncbi:MAG: protein kinase [Acidobacteria bacterium]|nr:protein kinase [Acidobacteriota bacterium]MCB9399677.1 protein kinase [Acidobacteriota bacterium]
MLLVIEKDARFVEKLRKSLKVGSHLIHFLADSNQALAFLGANQVDAIVLDLNSLVAWEDYQALIRFRDQHQIPLLFLEGHRQTTELAQRLRAKGENQFLAFPFRVSELTKRLEVLLKIDPLIGQKIGPAGQEVILKRKLGSGSMGKVYEAIQPDLDRKVAVKFLETEMLKDETESMSRFLNEARTLAQIRSPYVVQIYFTGRHENYVYLVMEFVDGCDLSRYLQTHKRLKQQAALALIHQVLMGLEEAHRRGKIHRDIKPGNIMINKEGQALLLDFGLVRENQAAGQTQPGTVLGTPLYLSPEQARGERVGPAADLYAVGIVLYELLTGRAPFQGKDFIEILVKHLHAPIPDPDPGLNLDPRVWQLIMDLTHKEVDQRLNTASLAREKCERLVGELSNAANQTQTLAAALDETRNLHSVMLPTTETPPWDKPFHQLLDRLQQVQGLSGFQRAVFLAESGSRVIFEQQGQLSGVHSQRKEDHSLFLRLSREELAKLLGQGGPYEPA